MKKWIALMVLVLSLIGLYGLAFSGDGGEDPACPAILPDPKHGPFLSGTFTVAYDKGSCSLDFPCLCGHYNVQIVSKKGRDVHLFSFKAGLVGDGTGCPGVGYKNLCSFTNADLKETFKYYPCKKEVGEAFGISGIPVIADLHILVRDFCDSQNFVDGTNIVEDAMIAGEIVIRVVPLPK